MRKKKKRKRERRRMMAVVPSLCRMPPPPLPPPRFSRATLVRVSYYLTLPYGFPLNRECCSLNFIKAVSPSFESCQCAVSSKATSRFPYSRRTSVDSARISRSAKSFLRFVDLLVVLLIEPRKCRVFPQGFNTPQVGTKNGSRLG